MHIQPLKICALALGAALSFASAASAADAPTPSNKWRIEVSGGQSTDSGEVQFRLTPHDGDAMLITAKVARGRGEMAVAAAILDAFKKQMPLKHFGAEIVAVQRVIVKTRPGEAEFLVEVVDSGIPGIRVHLTRG